MAKAQEIQFYDHHTRELGHSQRHKIAKFLEHGCIQKVVSIQGYVCKPIPGYNKRTYVITWRMGFLICNCQHFVMENSPCSHIGAVWEWIKRNDGSKQGELW